MSPHRILSWRALRRGLPIVLAAVLAPALAAAGEVRVAVAANFAPALARIGEGFSAATGHRLLVSAGSTGRFHAQIVAGAPFEVLLAADAESPARLIAGGQAVAGTAFTYATGRLVLWSARPGVVDDRGEVLGSDRFEHLAIANPAVAPYGAAAMQVLRARGLADRLAGRLVTGESIAQAYQFVATGNAQLGFVALSQLRVAGKPAGGSSWLVPESLHAPLDQVAVLLKPGVGNPAAEALLAYLRSDAARAVIREVGYGIGAAAAR